MVYLTLFCTGKNNRKNRVSLEFRTLLEAVEFGQRSGDDYEIFDPVTGRNIDWNEINIRNEEEWFYDEKEMAWKKTEPDDTATRRWYSIACPGNQSDAYLCQGNLNIHSAPLWQNKIISSVI